MLFVRPVLTQYYRRGRSLGRRDFSSQRSFYNNVDVVTESGISVIENMFNTSLALGLGTGLGYLIMGYNNSSEYAQEVEENWERRKLELQKFEANLERLQRKYGVKRDV
ncbi:uncharacterized protein LOC108857503 [Raphanus sativus]|uniref:Uncharacterized protein LOC108857503 n=1 Tax=Raphanus sativus TaxID=3726 RepID=A0A6J0NS63_RAPSA|nr:uncharacterized protein LOC108857503 [Raphanus sativus]